MQVTDTTQKSNKLHAREKYQVLLKRELTDEESLLRTFGQDGKPDTGKPNGEKSQNEEDTIELEIKRNFYYVISPDGEIIDCAKIYSFLHEENIFRRIVARVSKHVDTKINKAAP